MSFRAALAASVLLAFGPTAFAQEAPAAPPPVTAEAEAAIAAAEAAFQPQFVVFSTAMGAMHAEMRDAISAADGDRAKAEADIDAIIIRYQPQANASAEGFVTFMTGRLPSMPAEAQARTAHMVPVIRDQMTGMPATIKVRLLEQADEDGEWEDGADE